VVRENGHYGFQKIPLSREKLFAIPEASPASPMWFPNEAGAASWFLF
jgi:hypothetical protein